MIIAILLASSIMTAPAFAAPSKAAPAKIPSELLAIEKSYAEAGTLQAQYSQVTFKAAMNSESRSSGNLSIKRPDKLKWEQTQPDTSLTLSDGRTVWFYTPPFDKDEKGQLIQRKSSQVNSKLANALLSGSFSSNARNMKIERKSPILFDLRPKKGTAGSILRAELEIDPQAKLIRKVTLFHEGGNRSEIGLSGIKLGEKLEDSLFKFSPPPNTDIVKE